MTTLYFYATIYLYVMGATVMWWFARAQPTPRSGKILAVIGWPLVVPVAALWG